MTVLLAGPVAREDRGTAGVVQGHLPSSRLMLTGRLRSLPQLSPIVLRVPGAMEVVAVTVVSGVVAEMGMSVAGPAA